MKKLTLLLLAVVLGLGYSYAQRTITGSIVDDIDEPMIGANIIVKGTTIGTVTDFEGNFQLEVPENATSLVISYTGYSTQEVAITGLSTVNVVLLQGTLLDEVVVVGYGSMKRQQITGSVGTLKADQINDIATGNVVQGLEGKVAGVRIIQQNGQPGANPSVRFRGIGSLSASNEPLYVVDGVPFNGNINAIAPQDIESISFLKDASANALYGSRGANGVVVITTKKADKSQPLQVTVSTKFGMNDRAVPEYDIISDPAEFYEVWFDRVRIGLINNGEDPTVAAQTAASTIVEGGEFSLGYNSYDVPNDQLIDASTGTLNPSARLRYTDDWQEELFDRSFRSETHVGLRSGSENLSSFFSLGYLDNEGYALNSGFERYSARANLEFTPGSNWTFGATINYAHTDQDAPIQNVGSSTYSNAFSWARNVAPIYPVYAYDEAGNRMFDNQGNTLYDFGTNDDGIPGVRPYGAFNNPVATSLLDIDNNLVDNLSGRVYATINFLRDFKFTYKLGVDYVGQDITALATPIGGDASNVNGRLTSTNTTELTIAHQQLLEWTKDFGVHALTVMVGHESNDLEFDLLRGQKTELLLGELPLLNNGANIQYLEGYSKTYGVEGYLSRVNYSYDNKVFVNASFRRDGSSVFHPDVRWGNFYGLGVAYDLARSNLFGEGGAINSLRLKASFGQQGNDALTFEQNQTIIGDPDNRNYFAYQNQYNVVNAGGGVPGVNFVTLGNPALVWESSTNVNAGFEGSFFNNRLVANAEYFVRKVEDLIFYKPLPVSEGRGSLPDNVGDMQNTGVELTLEGTVIQNQDFSLRLHFNGTHFTNEITALPQEFIDDGRFRLEEGRSRYEYFMREYAGVDESNGDALWFKDILDDDGNPTGEQETTNEWSEATEYFTGKDAIPDLYGGFGTTVGYKGFGLYIDFTYQIGGYGYDGLYQGLLPSAGDVGHNYHKDVLDSWTPENTTASLPRIDAIDDDQNNTSDNFLIDQSFLSLQNITLSYTPNLRFLSDIGIERASILLTANNVKLWSEREGYDPRLSVVGNAINEYSIVRSTSIGINLTF